MNFLYRNRITGTNPSIFHAPGLHDRGRNAMFDEIVDYCLQQPGVVDSEVEVIVCNNQPATSVLERVLRHTGQPHSVLGKHIHDWNHGYKHSLYMEHLGRSKFRYTLAMDGFDACYYGDLRRAVELLERHGKDWIFNGDHERWPCWPLNTPRCYEEFQRLRSRPQSPWRYINAGCWIARTEYALSVVRKARNVADDLHDSNEQRTYHYLFPCEADRMGIDYLCEVFQTELRSEMLDGHHDFNAPPADRTQETVSRESRARSDRRNSLMRRRR